MPCCGEPQVVTHNGNDDETAQEPLGSQDAPGEDGDIQSHQLDELQMNWRGYPAEVGNISMGAALALSAILIGKLPSLSQP